MMNSKWTRESSNPIIPIKSKSWKEDATACPDIICLGEKYFLYYAGQSKGYEQIGVMTIDKEKFNGKIWNDYFGNPVLKVGNSGDFDSKYVTDPATVNIKGTVYLYYSGIGEGADSIGLATSADGYNFKKYKFNPIFKGRAPEIVYRNGSFYLFCVDENKTGGYQINLAISKDGYNFKKYHENPVFRGSRSWDSYSVTTPRIFCESDGNYYMIYASDNGFKDLPRYFGLAISKDLYNWKNYAGSPFFEVGKPGAWDDKAIWFGTICKVGNVYFMWYEGCNTKGISQIGLVKMEKEEGS